MNYLLYALFCFLIYGSFYQTFEIFWTALESKKPELVGHTSIYMFILGGLVGVILSGFLLLFPSLFLTLIFSPVFILFGGVLITIIEFLSGILLNKLLKFNLWDYSKFKFNLFGQIELFHSIGWCGLSIVIFWISSILKHYFI